MDFPYEFRAPLVQMRKEFRSLVWLCLISAFVSLNGAKAQSPLTLRGHSGWISSLAYSTDGKWLASGSSDGSVKVWSTTAWTPDVSLHVSTGEIRSIAFSPDGKTLAAGIRYGTVMLWDVPSKKERATLKGHKSDVWSVAFFPDGKILASADGDWDQPGEVKLWDTATGRERGMLKHSGEVLCLAVSPNGQSLAAGSWDKTIRVW